VLGDVRLACLEGDGQAADLARSVLQDVEDLEAARTGEDLEDLGLVDGDLVHGSSMRSMRMCA
jgi:hypothetical protein